jgi:hypothetical protein
VGVDVPAPSVAQSAATASPENEDKYVVHASLLFPESKVELRVAFRVRLLPWETADFRAPRTARNAHGSAAGKVLLPAHLHHSTRATLRSMPLMAEPGM